MEARRSTDYITFVIVVSAFAVLTLHTNNCFWFYSGKEDYWFSANIIECAFYFAVQLFFMVSGIALMDFFDRYSMKRFFARRFMKTMQYLSTLLEKGFQFGLECHVQRFYVGRIFDMAAVRMIVAQL